MRIISGSAKGRVLYSPKSNAIRPALDRVKEAIFNILMSIEGLKVLDLFAGTGCIGLEAASRGASQVVFVDARQEAITLIHKNARRCQLENLSTIIKGRLPQILRRVQKIIPHFDLVFVDPPYDHDLVNPALQGLTTHKLIDARTLIIVEHSPREEPYHQQLQVVDARSYGQTRVSFLKIKT